MRRQHQHPRAGSPPQAVRLQAPGRLIPAAANDNGRNRGSRMTAVAAAAAILAAGLLLMRLLG